jgi:hypothetical protein
MAETKPKDFDLYPNSDQKVIGKERLSVNYDQILSDIMKELNGPLRLHATFPTADAKLNFEAGNVTLGDGAERNLPPLKSQIFTIPTSTVDFQTQATTGATFIISWPASTVGQFRRVGFTLISSGEIQVLFSDEGASLGVLADPGTLFAKGGIPLGYVDLECTNVAGYFKTAGSATDVIENSGVHRFGNAGGAGSGAGDAVAFYNEMDIVLFDSFFAEYTPIVFSIDEDNFVDGASSGAYSIADGVYKLDLGQNLTTINLFDASFISAGLKSLKKRLVVDYLTDATRDDSATYEASIDGGTNWEAITLVRQDDTQRFIGDISMADQVSFLDLRVRITASANDKQIENIAIFYDEQLSSTIGGVKKKQLFIFNGDDDVTEFQITNFLPDSDLLTVYLEGGQSFKYANGDFTLGADGRTITFNSGDLLIPGETNLKLLAVEFDGASFDNSDENGALLAAMGAGSMDNTIDKSQPGLGPIMKDGTTNKRNRLYIDNGILYIEELE